METRQSEQVVNGVGRQQIAKSQDRTAGDVVKRIPGVTIIGDRFVMIRGLADRYNTRSAERGDRAEPRGRQARLQLRPVAQRGAGSRTDL